MGVYKAGVVRRERLPRRHVQEWQFTTVQGERVEMPFKGLPAGP
jgi:hypothetical protein